MPPALFVAILAAAAAPSAYADPDVSAPECGETCQADDDMSLMQNLRALHLHGQRQDVADGKPYAYSPDGPCTGPAETCDAPGWVYCQDAECQEPTVVDGVLVAKCLCWAPKNTNQSVLPGKDAGASCVINQQRTGEKLVEGGAAMCDAIKKGSLISTWGPKGWKPPIVTAKCGAGTAFGWCWGAPCTQVAGDIVCDCPMVTVDSDAAQYLSLSSQACAEESDPCKMTHNGDPAGSAVMLHRHMAQCSSSPDPCPVAA